MRKIILTIAVVFYAMCMIAQNSTFETAAEAVRNMKVGWNLGNTLDSHTGYTGNDWRYWETIWSQPLTKPRVIKMMKEAGFNVIRVPVTWYPHMDEKGKVDSVWMRRVHEVVDYVMDEGMYCLLNVHHDTGAHETAWIVADSADYVQKKEKFEYLWRQIATEFKDYGERLLFEGYNEMLDPYYSWGYASYKTSGQYDEEVARSAYYAVNAYAQSFVNAVRSTGGNNSVRNLVCSIYCASEGTGADWNKHLQDPVKAMKMPDDEVQNHLAVEMHYYRTLPNMETVRKYVDFLMDNLQTYLADRLGVPVIIGEWGPRLENGDAYEIQQDYLLQFADYFIKQAKAHHFATLYWMGMSNKLARLWPYFNQPLLAEAVLKAYYGDDYNPILPTVADYDYDYTTVTFTSQWGEFYVYKGDTLDLSEWKAVRVELAEAPKEKNTLQIRGYGVPAGTNNMSSVNFTKSDTVLTLTFDQEKMNHKLTHAVIVNRADKELVVNIRRAFLIKHDGTEVETELSCRNRCLISDIIAHPKSSPTAVSQPGTSIHDHAARPLFFTLTGQRVSRPSMGIYIINGKKIVISSDH